MLIFCKIEEDGEWYDTAINTEHIGAVVDEYGQALVIVDGYPLSTNIVYSDLIEKLKKGVFIPLS